MQRKDASFSHPSTPHWTAATRALRGLSDDLDAVSPTFDVLQVGFVIRKHLVAQSEHRIK